MTAVQYAALGFLSIPALWGAAAITSHAWHTVKHYMIGKLGPAVPRDHEGE